MKFVQYVINKYVWHKKKLTPSDAMCFCNVKYDALLKSGEK